MTDTVVNSFNVLTQFPFPLALVVTLITTMNNPQMLSLVVNIEFRFTFTFVTTYIAYLYHIQMNNFDVVEKNALTPHFNSTVFTRESHPKMLSFNVVL